MICFAPELRDHRGFYLKFDKNEAKKRVGHFKEIPSELISVCTSSTCKEDVRRIQFFL